ncbi:MAG: EamA family transporter [Alphaproteobacteria bacterium]|nr:EamA family transporter [Alphaproteobacteria bacterium]
MLLRIAPVLFVLLWSTGFIGSKVGGEYAEPFTFLTIRFALVLALLLPWAIATRRDWPSPRIAIHAAMTGFLIHTVYIGGVLWALSEGMPAGVVAVIVSTQPILTAILAGPLLGEWPGPRHIAGLGIGLCGVLLVLGPKLSGSAAGDVLSLAALASVLAALAGITFGTLNQKRHGMSGSLLTLTIYQYAGAFISAAVLALSTETMKVDWTLEFWLATAWLVVVLSIGAILLLMMLIRASAVSKVTSLFYLVPATTALMAAIMFGEQLIGLQLVGIGLVMAAVFLIRPMATAAPRQ